MGKWWSSWSWGSGKLPSSCLIQIIPALYNLSSGTSFSILPAKKKESLSLSSREKFSIKVSFLLKIFLASPTLYLILGSLRSWSLCVHSTYLSSIFLQGFHENIILIQLSSTAFLVIQIWSVICAEFYPELCSWFPETWEAPQRGKSQVLTMSVSGPKRIIVIVEWLKKNISRSHGPY